MVAEKLWLTVDDALRPGRARMVTVSETTTMRANEPSPFRVSDWSLWIAYRHRRLLL
jgi:hypothetical protein